MVARRHHYVPKCYLKAFSAQSDSKKNDLLVFDRVILKQFRTAADNVALERDFNTIEVDGHPPDAFEIAMASVESEIGPALERILVAQSLSNENDRTLLLNLVGLLHIRNPSFREIKRSFQDRIAKIVFDMVLSSRERWDSHVKRAKADGFISEDADVDYDKMKADYKPDSYSIEIPTGAHVVSEIDTFNHALPLLFERKWML